MLKGRMAVLTGVAVFAIFVVGLVHTPVASADVPSPAGTVGGGIIIFAPGPAAAPLVVPSSPSFVAPRGGLTVPVPPTPNAPGLPSIMLLTPTPATGSLVVPLVGPTSTQLQLVIPGPNPAQNTTVGLQQLLTTLLAPPVRGSSNTSASSGIPVLPVTVYAVPSR
jgi:hypothetical protein